MTKTPLNAQKKLTKMLKETPKWKKHSLKPPNEQNAFRIFKIASRIIKFQKYLRNL